jgi:hypothetical protein
MNARIAVVTSLLWVSAACSKGSTTAGGVLAYSQNPASYTVGVAIAPNVPSGAGPATYSVSPPLPAGLSLDTGTGLISGAASVAALTAQYTVTAAGAASTKTVVLTITVATPPSIVVNPRPQSVVPGMPAFFTVVAAGTGTVQYQWFEGATPIAGATSPTLLTGPAAAVDDGQAFSVVVTDVAGATAQSTAATLSVVSGESAGPRSALDHSSATLLSNGTVVFTGGGSDGSAAVRGQNIEHYDPATGAFSLSPASAILRDNSKAALLPNGDILIVGGNASIGIGLQFGELYDPIARTILPTANDMHAAREHHTATTLPNGLVLVAGGDACCEPTFTSAVDLYDPSTNAFVPAPDMPDARYAHTATLLQDGNVLIAGGVNDGVGDTTSSAFLFEFETGTFRLVSPMTTPRAFHTATLLLDGRVLMTGGTFRSQSPGGQPELASAEIYAPATETFTPTGSLAIARDSHAAVLLPDGKVLVTGGQQPASPPSFQKASLDDSEIFDPARNAFAPTTPLLLSRAFHTMTLLPAGDVIICGGVGGGSVRLDCEFFREPTDTFSAGPALTESRVDPFLAPLGNGSVLLAGGDASGTTAEVVDVDASQSLPTGSMHSAHTQGASAALPDGKAIVAGGLDGNGNPNAATDVYDPSSGTFSTAGAMVAPSTRHAATLLQNGTVLFTGGTVAGQPSTLAQIYDPRSNTFTKTGDLKQPRTGHTATLLANGTVLVAQGDDGSGVPTASTEVYVPQEGAFQPGGAMAIARDFATATLLADGRALFAGGIDGNGNVLASAEIYDPAHDSFSPAGDLQTARARHTATRLPDGTVLIAGGSLSSATDGSGATDSAEIFDPASGVFHQVPGLSNPRAATSAVLMPDGRVLLAGGDANGNALSSTELFRYW